MEYRPKEWFLTTCQSQPMLKEGQYWIMEGPAGNQFYSNQQDRTITLINHKEMAATLIGKY